MTGKTWDDEWLVRKGNYQAVITPEKAAELLARNTNNRRPKERKIEQYKRDMQAGAWDADASDIKVSRTGELIDGQNRLMACVRADVPFPTLLRTGLGLATKAKVDTGAARTVADVLKMNGAYVNASATAAAAALWVRYLYRINNFGGKRAIDSQMGSPLTHDEVLDFLDKHPTIQTFGSEADRMRRVLPALPTSSILCGLAWGAEKDEDLAHKIVDRLVNSEFGGIGDPLAALVAYAAMARGRQQGSPGYRGRQAQESHLHSIIRVWNALRNDEKITTRLLPRLTDRLVEPE
jgi:hypothetical protein